MKKQITGFISYKKDWRGNYAYHFHGVEMTEYGYITVMPHSFEVDIPDDFDPRGKQVEQLQAEKKKAMADFQNRVTEIERKISELTCLEMA